MQCKVCNAYIPEGYMYCPVCGEEIIIVSDFDIKLEDNIDMAALAETNELPDLSSLSTKEDIKEDTKVTNTPQTVSIDRKWIVLFAALALLFLVGCIFGGISISRYFSYEYQYEKALKEYESGDFKKAISTGKRLNSLGNDEKGKLLLADSYIGDHNYDAAIAVLYDALDDFPQDVTLYDRIVACYKAENNNAGIHELINNSKDSTLALRYSDYVSISPTFSLESGTYVEPDPIKLSAPGEGKIYYSVDGTMPTEDSLEYMGPIPLETGENVISAIYVNEKGIVSDVVTNTYNVELDIPDPPVLLVEPQTLSRPEMIGVMAPEDKTVYYTTDGSVPTTDSKEYLEPLLMPLGKSTFTFISVNSNGLVSEPVSASYNLNMNVAIAKDMAEYAISYQLMSSGEMTIGKSYKAEYGFADSSRIYYIINEYNGSTPTGRMFAVDIRSGELFKFSKEDKKCIRF